MAAVTESTRSDASLGNKRGVVATLAAVDNTDTWSTGLTLIEYAAFTPTTAASVAMTISGGTITFVLGSGASNLGGTAIAIGV